MSKSTLGRIGLLVVLLGFIVFQIRSQYGKRASDPSLPFGRTGLPSDGVPENDTKGLIPGNPDKTVADGTVLFNKVELYRSLHGKYPLDGNTFLLDVWNNPGMYGYASGRDAHKAFTNPDAKYSDIPMLKQSPNDAIVWLIFNKRPDGQPCGSPKSVSSRDVIAYTPLYYHQQVRHFNGSKDTMQPVGFYIVVWDNGLVQRIPYNQVRYVNVPGTNAWNMGFPGQAGAEGNFKTYDDLFGKVPKN